MRMRSNNAKRTSSLKVAFGVTSFWKANTAVGKMLGLAFIILIAVLQGQKVAGQFKCPSRSGFYADPVQCDLYHVCRKGEAEAKLCKDGLVFQDNNPLYERCDFPFNVNCGGRTHLQPAQASTHCPHRNGLFPDEGSKRCKGFWQCTDGAAAKMSCQTGLAFNPKSGTCQWPYLVPDCN